VRAGQSSIHVAYNSILEEASALADLEGVVLVHDDVELRDRELERKLGEAFADPGIAVVGVVGGRDHRAMQWWTGERRGYVTDEQQGVLDFGRGRRPVDTVDGLLLALSPWAARNLRFDSERYRGFHGYDAEICALARARGKQVVVWDIDVHHHNDRDAWYGDRRAMRLADLTWRLKWRRDAGAAKRAYWRLERAALRRGLSA